MFVAKEVVVIMMERERWAFLFGAKVDNLGNRFGLSMSKEQEEVKIMLEETGRKIDFISLSGECDL